MAIATMDVRETGFCDGAVAIPARLHLPPDFDPDRGWPAVVLSAPGSSARDPVAAIYARKLAGRGFVAITFDPSHRVAGGGAMRGPEDAFTRVEDLRRAVDHLETLPFVDAARIAVLGVCAGGGHAVDAALTEHRFKAVVTVAGTDAGQTNARDRALAQPLMVIVGSRRGSTGQYETGRALYGLARGPDRALVVIPDAGHHDLRHHDACIDRAIERLASFLHFHLEP